MSQQKVKSDKIIVVDLETTCTNEHAEQFQNEIIEIGLSVVNLQTLTAEKNLSLLIKPQRSEVTDFCTKLTGITPEDVADGLLLPEACEILINEYQTNQYLWGSWGDFDRLIVNRECKQYKAKFPFNRQHLNIKADFALTYGLDELIGLDKATKLVNLAFIGQHHRGVDDARTTAQILIGMINRRRDSSGS